MKNNKNKKDKPEAPRGPFFLAFETATATSSVALYEGEQILGAVDYRQGRTHARLVTVLAGRLLEDLEVPRDSLAGIFVAKGPGSYTGLRVGVSVAKGLAMALDIPILSASSLEILAWSVRDIAQAMDAYIVPMIDARRMEVYTATFDPMVRQLSGPRALVVEGEAFMEILENGRAIFLGDGAEKCRDYLELRGGIVFGHRLSSAAGLGGMIMDKYKRSEFEDLIAFEPFYLKDFVATVSKKNLLT